MKKSIGLIGLVCFLLIGCNPKPTTEVINEPFDKTMKEAELAETEQVTTVSKREDYLKKLAEIEQSLAEFDQVLENVTTVELKQAQGEIFKRWDDALNEIYQALEEQLSPSDMEKLREEQREWIKYRDDTAREAAAIYEGGTMESLEYISVQAGLTKEMCYELVDRYME